MNHHLVIRVVSKLLIPFILLFGLYVQFHGDFGPGGGFQAGVIFASAFVLYAFDPSILSQFRELTAARAQALKFTCCIHMVAELAVPDPSSLRATLCELFSPPGLA